MKLSLFLLSLGAVATLVAAPSVSVDAVAVSSDGRGLTVTYTVADDYAIVTPGILVSDGNDGYVPVADKHVVGVYGEINRCVSAGAHTFTWIPGQDFPRATKDVRVQLTAWSRSAPPDYMAVDLDFAEVRFYTSAEAVPGGLDDVRYKTSVLLMRKIPAAGVSWKMGSPTSESGRNKEREKQHTVTFTEDYYCAIFPVTQGQYRRAVGSLPKNAEPKNDNTQDVPVNVLSWNDVRGEATPGGDYEWPSKGHAVVSTSVIGKFRAKVDQAIEFDLPIDAQWEYACRAGTSTAWNNGENTTNRLDEIAWWKGNAGNLTQPVGRKKPNRWGIYDMHGNVYEYVLDYYVNPMPLLDETDPKGPDFEHSAGTGGRLCRGGNALDDWDLTRSAFIDACKPDYAHRRYGFRLFAKAVYSGTK